MQLALPLVAVGTEPSRPPAQPAEPAPPIALPPAPLAPHVPPNTPHGPVEFIRHPRARRYVIRVRSDGTVRVTVPRGGSRREGQEFVERQARWIEKQRERVARERTQPREAFPRKVPRELLERAKNELAGRLLELAAEHGLQVTRISVRNQRWRWGSCSRSGHICLNWRLVNMPPSVRDYVMIHELMHLKRMDHSPAFWTLVAAACPEYKAARTWLRHHGR